jgi:molybdenum cofactor biosynthesis protein A, bacterial
MPKSIFNHSHPFLPHSQLLSFEEIHQVAAIFLKLGVKKLRITGGEPLLRRHIEVLIEQLAQLKTLDGTPPELTMTTNATLLAKKAKALKAAGLNRVTISLDAIDDGIFRSLNDMDVPVATVLNGIDAALDAGLTPLKVNMVVRKGINDHQIIPMVEHFRHSGVILRFIEFMDVGTTNGWHMEEVLPSQSVIDLIHAHYSIHPLEPHTPSETAQRWAYDDGAGEIGVISSVTRAFCHSCSRARLSMEGRLFMCLFASAGYDLRGLLRQKLGEETLLASVASLWKQRDDHYSELRAQGVHVEHRVEMSYIGG